MPRRKALPASAGVIGLGLAVYGVAGAVVAIQALRRRAWARGIGIVLAALGVAALVVALIRPGQATGATPLIFVPVIARAGVRGGGVGQ